MVTDKQVRRLLMLNQEGKPLKIAALKSGMAENTARKYIELNKLPSDTKRERDYRTREDPYKDVWEEVVLFLENNPNIQAKTIFEYLNRRYEGLFKEGQLRTLQRRIKEWKAIDGKPKEVYFPQVHHPGDLAETDFTDMSKVKITIQRKVFKHLVYHFILTYSNWEYIEICYSESYDSLSKGLQNACRQLGKVPKKHRTDCLSAAVKHSDVTKESGSDFTQKYSALLNYYNIKASRTNPYSPNENGDVEQGHHRFKTAVDQALMLRGHRDFKDIDEYNFFLKNICSQRNLGRTEKLKEELSKMKDIPEKRFEDYKSLSVRVNKSSTIRVANNIYSAHSRLIGEKVNIRLFADNLEVWYANKLIEKIPRIFGTNNHYIDYHHIIDWLIRKPGAFENYKYKSDLFPNSRFRMAYDYFQQYIPSRADKEYIKILSLASKEGESVVDDALRYIIDNEQPFLSKSVASIVYSKKEVPNKTEVSIDEVNLSIYDELLNEEVFS